MATLVAPAAAQAQGGLAISGSFYRQAFEIPQGSSVSGPSIDVVVFNNGSEELRVNMTSQAPLGVNITLSHNDFTLPPGGQQQVLVGVEVTQDAAPGEYEISVTAESYREGVSGIQLAGAAGQTARLVVLGESALVTVRAVSPEQQPVVVTVRLYRVVAGQSHEVAYSETGTLEAKVAPGNFTAASYVGGEKLAEESFTVGANEKKTVNLSGATAYFEGFGIVPNYQNEGGKLAFVQIVYTVRNLYQRVAKGEVILEVSRDEAPLEELSLAALSPLELGQVGLNYNYIPAGGWVDGSYGFKLQLKLDGKPYTSSLVQQLEVSGGGVAGNGGGGGMSPAVVGGIVAGAVAVASAGFWFVWKRRKA
jgi:hypothetical protein